MGGQQTTPTTFDTRAAIERGYFPKELPRSFTTTSFAQLFGQSPILDTGRLPWTEPVRLNLRRPGGLRRPLSIPNPQSYLQVVAAMRNDWQHLLTSWADPPLESSTPVVDSRRYLSTKLTFAQLPRSRARLRSRARYVVHGDISQCYRSIYTHSFSWALVGKARAKLSFRDSTTAGFHLDRCIQSGQSGQTKGLPIGPDTSLVLAELVMTAVDRLLASRMGATNSLPALRLIDDFEYYARTRSEAEDALLGWETAAAHFELPINDEKTYVAELPDSLESPVHRDIRRYDLRKSSDARLVGDITDFFGTLFEHMISHPRKALAGYAIQRVNNELMRDMSQPVWDIYLDLALATAVADPSCLRFLELSLLGAQSKELSIDWDRVAATANEIASYHARLEHGSEVSWCLDLLRRFRRPIEVEAAGSVRKMDDNASLILLGDLVHQKLYEGSRPDLAEVSIRAETAGSLQSADWLMAYQYARSGWCRPHIVQTDSFFSQLLNAGVTFFEDSKTTSATIGDILESQDMFNFEAIVHEDYPGAV